MSVELATARCTASRRLVATVMASTISPRLDRPCAAWCSTKASAAPKPTVKTAQPPVFHAAAASWAR